MLVYRKLDSPASVGLGIWSQCDMQSQKCGRPTALIQVLSLSCHFPPTQSATYQSTMAFCPLAYCPHGIGVDAAVNGKAAALPVCANKDNLKFLARFFDFPIGLHQNPSEASAGRALQKTDTENMVI